MEPGVPSAWTPRLLATAWLSPRRLRKQQVQVARRRRKSRSLAAGYRRRSSMGAGRSPCGAFAAVRRPIAGRGSDHRAGQRRACTTRDLCGTSPAARRCGPSGHGDCHVRADRRKETGIRGVFFIARIDYRSVRGTGRRPSNGSIRRMYMDPQHEEALIHLALILDRRGDRGRAAAMHERMRRMEQERAKSNRFPL